MGTIFQKNAITEPALFTPFDTTKKIEDFPEICVSTFSENIIQKFASLKSVEKIAELYTANGALPVYKIYYKNQDIAFYLSRVGAPACVAGFEEVVAIDNAECAVKITEIDPDNMWGYTLKAQLENKSTEKNPESEEDLLQHRTDGTDAFDTLYIGCEKFPQHDFYWEFVGGVR